MSLSDIATVTIQAGTSQPSRRGFGTPLLLGYHTRFVELVRTYTSLKGMLDDGFTVNDPMYLMASAVFSQNPRPTRVKIGRLDGTLTAGAPFWMDIDLSTMVSGDSITLTVRDSSGNAVEFTQAFVTSVANTATLLANAINVDATLVDIGSQSGLVDAVTVSIYDDAATEGKIFFIEGFDAPDGVTLRDTSADRGYDTALANILNVDSDFYGVALETSSDTNVQDVATWVLANDRILGVSPQVDAPATYATAATLLAADNDRTFSIVSQKSQKYFAGAAALGAMLSWDPGSQTWAFKPLAGVPVDTWNASDLTAIESDNGNHYTSVAGLNMLRYGKTHGGEFIDITRGIDYIKYRLQEDIVALLANNRKVPFTDSGGQQIESVIRKRLVDAANKGIITEDSIVVDVPLVADILAADRAARHFSGVEFSATLQGAVHKVTLVGTVSV